MTNKEAINYLKETEGYTFSGIDNPKHNEAINLAIKALDVMRRLDGFKYVTTDVFLKEHELAHFDVYKTGWNDAIEAVKKASDRPLSEIINAIKETEAEEGYNETN